MYNNFLYLFLLKDVLFTLMSPEKVPEPILIIISDILISRFFFNIYWASFALMPPINWYITFILHFTIFYRITFSQKILEYL